MRGRFGETAQYLGWAGGVVFGAAWLAGCASPAPPTPPSLKLPDTVKDLTAERVGGEVRLRWTTPARTTDGLGIVRPIPAEICRDSGGQALAATCVPIATVRMMPGAASQWTDGLAGLAGGAPTALAYRVQLRSAAGRTAGPSAPAYAASGSAPGAIAGLRGVATKAGAVLEWSALATGAEPDGGWIEVRRVAVPKAPAAGVTTASAQRKGSPLAAPVEPVEVRLKVAATEGADPGGTIDRTAQLGRTYRYSVQRVRTPTLGGRPLEMRSADSGEVTVAMLDVFPPEPATGLVAVPGFAGGARPTIDLSWEPSAEPRVTGYRVYRREFDGGDWVRVSSDSGLLTAPAYRDMTVAPGRRYVYRVTVVDAAGNESMPGNEAAETAGTP